MFKEFDNRIPLEIRDYSDYLMMAYGRLEMFSNRSGIPVSGLRKASVIDIGGGMIGNNYDDGSTFRDPQYFPYFPVICALKGMEAINLDRANKRDDHYPQAAVLESFYTHISVNLAKDLLQPQNLYDKVKSRSPQSIGNITLVNSSHLVTLKHAEQYANSPWFLRSLGVPMNSFGEPVENSEHKKELIKAVTGVFAFSHMVLGNNGYLFFNNELYKKVGENLVHIPDDSRKDALRTIKEMVGKPARDIFNKDKLLKEGTYCVDKNICFRVNNGLWEISDAYENSLFPLP